MQKIVYATYLNINGVIWFMVISCIAIMLRLNIQRDQGSIYHAPAILSCRTRILFHPSFCILSGMLIWSMKSRAVKPFSTYSLHDMVCHKTNCTITYPSSKNNLGYCNCISIMAKAVEGDCYNPKTIPSRA